MESINNAASAASRAVFGGSSGQSGQEPVSGQTGRGTAGEPYDAGNTMDNPRLAGLPGDDARPTFSSGRDRDERSDREDGAYGGSTYGSDNPYASSTTGTSTMGPGHTTSTSGQPGETGNQHTMGSGYTSSSGQPGGTGNQHTMGSGYTSSTSGQTTTMPGTSTMGPGHTSSTGGQPGATGTTSIPGLDDFMNVPGGHVQVIDEGPAASGIAGRFGPSHGVDLDGHQFSADEGRSAPASGTGGTSFNTTGGSTTAVNTSGSSGMTGSDNTSRNIGSQDNSSSHDGMTGSDNTSRGMTGQDNTSSSSGTTGSGSVNIPGDIAGRTGESSSRLTGQDDSMSGPTGGMQQGANVQGNRPRPEHNTDKTGVTDMHSNDPKFSDVRQSDAGGSSVDTRGQSKGPTGGFGAAEPSVSADPTSGQKPTPKQQGADRPMEEPSGEQADAVKREKETTEKQQAGQDPSSGNQDKKQPKKDPNDHSGEPLGSVDHSGGGGDKKAKGQEGGGAHGEDKENQGTGEIWVKTSGMAADGGDFDASKPGAGKEADRLMEQKGIHHEPGMGKPAADPHAPHDTSNKEGVASKIKGKLHLG